jgi:hypothetical protein
LSSEVSALKAELDLPWAELETEVRHIKRRRKLFVLGW